MRIEIRITKLEFHVKCFLILDVSISNSNNTFSSQCFDGNIFKQSILGGEINK